jgi:hypothetical protein
MNGQRLAAPANAITKRMRLLRYRNYMDFFENIHKFLRSASALCAALHRFAVVPSFGARPGEMPTVPICGAENFSKIMENPVFKQWALS